MKSALIKTENSLEFSHHDIALLEDLLAEGMLYIDSDKFADKDFCQSLLSFAVKDVDSSWVINHLNAVDGIAPGKTSEKVQFKVKEEKMIFLKYNYLKKLIHTMSSLNLPETYGKMVDMYHEVQAIKETIAAVNMAIVINLANSNTFMNIDFADAVSEGNGALNVSIDKFSVDSNNKFSTYLYKSITSALIKSDSKGSKQSLGSVEYDSETHEGAEDRDPVISLVLKTVNDIINGGGDILSDEEQFVLKQRYEEGKTLDQIGEEFDPPKPRGVVFYIDKRAKDKMREYLD